MKPFLLSLFFLFFLIQVFSQTETEYLTPMWDMVIDGNQGEKVHDVILTTTGLIAAVGETKKGKFKQGLFLLIDPEKGGVIKREEFGGNKDDVFYSISEADEQSLYLAGTSDKGGALGKQAWIVRLDETGELLDKKLYNQKGSEFREIVWNDGNTGSLAGYRSADGKGNVWFSRINHKLELFDETIIGEGVYGTIKGMEKIAGDSVWLCGETRKSPGYSKGDIWVSIVNDREREIKKIWGSKQIENINNANLSLDGNLLLAGETFKTPTGINAPLLIEMNRRLDTVLMASLKGKEPNQASAIFKSYYNGYWAIVHPDPKGGRPGLGLTIQSEQDQLKTFSMDMAKGSIDFRAIDILYVPFGKHVVVGNSIDEDAIRLICLGDAELKPAKEASGLLSMTLTKPNMGRADDLGTKKTSDSALLTHVGSVLKDDKNDDGILSLGERGSFQFKLVNNDIEDLLFLKVKATLESPVDGLLLTKKVDVLPFLKKGGFKLFSFGLKTNSSFQDGTATILIEVFDGSTDEKPIYHFKHDIDCRRNAPVNTGVKREAVVMRWMGDATNSREFEVYDNDVKLDVITTVNRKNVKLVDFKVSNNGILLQDEKTDPNSFLSDPKESEAGRFDYHFVYDVNGLAKGRNVIVVEVDGFKDSIIVNYNIDEPNLHVLAIGVTGGTAYEGLKFTAKDAEDFCEAIGLQKERGFFNKVYIEPLTTEESTTKTSIVSAFEKLYNRYESGEAIKEKDYVMIYYSGHGDKDGDKFLMLPSNYDRESRRSTSIDFREEIREEFLDKMKCKRILFFDACMSGSAKNETLTVDELQEAIIRANKVDPGMVSIASCTSNELSFESKNNENGIFTEALIEALNGDPVVLNSGLKLSVSDDNLVNIGELYDFLKVRVLDLVQAANPNRSQKPTLSVDELDRDLDIFVIK